MKNVVVTGYCKSCNEEMISDRWLATQVVKRPEQKDALDYLPVGGESNFSFNGIAHYFSQSSAAPKEIPKKLDVVVKSFEIVQ